MTIDDYTVLFSEPQNYTVIQVKRDRFAGIAFAGGMLIIAGLVLALYIQTQRIWAVENDDGSWNIYGYSRKGGVIFKEQIEQIIEGLNKETESNVKN